MRPMTSKTIQREKKIVTAQCRYPLNENLYAAMCTDSSDNFVTKIQTNYNAPYPDKKQ